MQWFWSLDESTRAALVGAAAAFVTALMAAAATFATALITLFSVAIGLFVNRLSQQAERRLTLRREVYLNAAKSFAASTQVLSSMANPLTDIQTASPIIGEFAAAVAQVQLVGDERAMKAAVALQREFVKIYTDIVIRRMPLVQTKQTVDANTARVTQISSLRLEDQQAINWASQELARLQRENDRLLRELFEGQMRLTRELMDEVDKLAPFSMEATLAAKEEFGIRVAEKDYADFLSKSTQNLKNSVLSSLADLEQQVAEMNQPSPPTNPERES
jgi:hypothetical protein